MVGGVLSCLIITNCDTLFHFMKLNFGVSQPISLKLVVENSMYLFVCLCMLHQ